MIENFLLTDETSISEKDMCERKKLYEEFCDMPEDFFAKMRHFQPQVGCLNCCRICSKFANANVEFWNESRIRNVISALKLASIKYRLEKPYIVYDRKEHRNGVIFSYLDNDVGNYFYLDKFIKLAYNELGVVTRISTVGFSRHNTILTEMHKRINQENMLNCLGGVRLSFTPYEIGWQNDKNGFSRDEYVNDMAEFLKIYRPYYNKYGTGSRKMCIEIRYSPLAVRTEVYIFEYQGHYVISSGHYLFISCQKNINFRESKIADSKDHSIKLTEQPIRFFEIEMSSSTYSYHDIDIILSHLPKKDVKVVDAYYLLNADGGYFSFDPSISEDGNCGINIYPITEKRKNSGYIITERFFLNALFRYKHSVGLQSMDMYESATWEDVFNVISLLKSDAEIYKQKKQNDKSDYIQKEVVPMIESYVQAIIKAGYSAKDFFDFNFTIDTGIICNLGRAIYEFQGLTYKVNEPLTPTHERNYGSYNSLMTKENYAWRMSCDYDDNIVIEKLNLKDTSSKDGQVKYTKKIKLDKSDERMDIGKLNFEYLVPGQKLK